MSRANPWVALATLAAITACAGETTTQVGQVGVTPGGMAGTGSATTQGGLGGLSQGGGLASGGTSGSAAGEPSGGTSAGSGGSGASAGAGAGNGGVSGASSNGGVAGSAGGPQTGGGSAVGGVSGGGSSSGGAGGVGGMPGGAAGASGFGGEGPKLTSRPCETSAECKGYDSFCETANEFVNGNPDTQGLCLNGHCTFDIPQLTYECEPNEVCSGGKCGPNPPECDNPQVPCVGVTVTDCTVNRVVLTITYQLCGGVQCNIKNISGSLCKAVDFNKCWNGQCISPLTFPMQCKTVAECKIPGNGFGSHCIGGGSLEYTVLGEPVCDNGLCAWPDKKVESCFPNACQFGGCTTPPNGP